MDKIPVGRTIAQSYGFAFGRYFTLLGILWLPLLVSCAMTYYFRVPLMEGMAAQAHNGGVAEFASQFQRINLLIQLVGLLLFAVISVGITKEVLGLRTGWRFFYAGFGAAELRVIVGYFALLLLFIVFVVIFAVGVAVLAAIAGAAMKGAASPVARPFVALAIVLIGFGFWLFLVYASVRMTFLFLPVTVAERRIGILRSWELTKGNFWRIFGIGIIVLAPLIVLSIAFAMQILGTDYLTFAMQHAKEPDLIRAHVMERTMMMYQNLPLLFAGMFVLFPVIYGLLISPAAFAYRALVPLPADAAAIPEPQVKKEEPELPKEIEEILDKPSEHGEDEKH
jgi:hypothetical protein